MQNLKQPSGFFEKSTRDPQGKEKGLIAPNSKSSSIDYFANSYYYGL